MLLRRGGDAKKQQQVSREPEVGSGADEIEMESEQHLQRLRRRVAYLI